MTRIGLLSDTHGFVHPRVFDFFEHCDVIWHAGDIGDEHTLRNLQSFKPLVAVYGNIDGADIRMQLHEEQIFTVESVKVFMTHIGGYPRKYAKGVKEMLKLHCVDLFICGHSHILRIIHDSELNLLYINPGAAGLNGFHQKITFIRFVIHQTKILDLEVMEIDRKTIVTSADQLNGST